MHDVEIRQEIVDRVLARRNRYHLFESLDPAATALTPATVVLACALLGIQRSG